MSAICWAFGHMVGRFTLNIYRYEKADASYLVLDPAGRPINMSCMYLQT